MLQNKHYSSVDMMFSFVAAFIEKETGYSASPWLTEFHTIYLDVVNAPLYRREGLGFSEGENSNLLSPMER